MRKANVALLVVVLLGVAAYAAVWQYRRDMAQKEAAMYFTDPQIQKAAEAIVMGDPKALETVLQHVRNINATSPSDSDEKSDLTLLILAVKYNRLDCVKVLLQHGADPNFNPKKTRNALAWSSWLKDHSIFYYLMQNGGNPNLKNYRGEPLTFDAATNDHYDEVRYLLDHGADINAKGLVGEPLIILISRWGKFDQVAKLIERGADYTTPDATGATVAFLAQDATNLLPAGEAARLIARLRRMMFGRSSEKTRRQIEQLELKLEELQATEVARVASTQTSSQEPTQTPLRRALPEHLPREVATHMPAHDACPGAAVHCASWAKMSPKCSSMCRRASRSSVM